MYAEERRHRIAQLTLSQGRVAVGRRVVLIADHTKVHDEHFAIFAGIADVDVIVTDGDIDDDDACAFDEAGVEMVLT